VILEFNNIVDLKPREWKSLLSEFVKELGLDAEPLKYTKSQIMFGYKGAKVLSNLDGEPYDIATALKEATKVVGIGREKKPTLTQARKLLDDPLNTFKYAFNDDVEARSLVMYRMWKHIFDLGGTADEAEQLMKDLNYNFWTNPIEDDRFEKYIKQMRRAHETQHDVERSGLYRT
jgi:hypothetical protein